MPGCPVTDVISYLGLKPFQDPDMGEGEKAITRVQILAIDARVCSVMPGDYLKEAIERKSRDRKSVV